MNRMPRADKPPGAGITKRIFARYYDRLTAEYEEYMAPRKRKLFVGVSGTVVEIGPGTGANLRFLPADCRWVGIEPNPYMHEALRRRAREAGIEPEFHTASAGRIEMDDAVADTVISTLVLCSVPDARQVLSEVRRILRPGGRYLFIEHVAAASGTLLRLVQRLMWPVWYLIGDGCHISRNTGQAIQAAGFASVRMDEFRLPSPPAPPWVSPHVAGEAVR